MGAAQTTMKEDTKRGSFLTASTTGASLWIRSEKHLDAARSSRTSVQCSSVRPKNSSETPPDHHSRMKHCDPDIPRNSNNTDTTTRSALGKPAHDYDTSEDGDGHRTPVAETNGVPNRDFVTLAMTERRGHGFSDSESDGEDWKSDDAESESDGGDSESDGGDCESDDGDSESNDGDLESDGGDLESDGGDRESDGFDCESNDGDRESDGGDRESDGFDCESDDGRREIVGDNGEDVRDDGENIGDDGESVEESDGSSASRDEGGNSGGTNGWSTSDEEDEEVTLFCTEEVDGDSDGSWSSLSSSSWRRSSLSSRSSDCGSSGHNLSFWSLGSNGMLRWKSRRASFSSSNNGRRCLQSKRVQARVQARNGALLSEGELGEEQIRTELRGRIHAIRLELSRECFHLEVVKQEEAQTRQQLTSKYNGEIEKFIQKVRDERIFQEKILDKLAEYKDETESVGRDAGQAKSDDASAELEARQRSNIYLITELQDLRQKYQAQNVTLQQERKALADAREALEAK